MGSEHNDTPTSDHDLHEVTDIIKPWVIVMIFIIIIVLCTIGNSLVLFVILARKHMRTVTNCFIASLSVSDLLIGFVVVSLAIVQTVNRGALDGAACHLPIFFGSICCTASIFSLLAISLDRYMAVIHSTMKTFTVQKSIIVITGVWIWSLVYSSKAFLLDTHFAEDGRETDPNVPNNEKHFCNLLAEEHNEDFWFRVTDALVLFVLPLVAMMYMYIRISRRLWFTKMAVTTSVRNKRKIVKFLICDIILFFLTWAPFYVVELIVDNARVHSGEEEEEVEHSTSHFILRFTFIVLALSNSFLNPVLYAFFNQNLQTEIAAVFKRSNGRVSPQVFHVNVPCPGTSRDIADSGVTDVENVEADQSRTRFTKRL